MIDFVNTLDTIDDVVLADKLIDKSISGAYNDDKITTIGGIFSYCKNLTSVCFPIATAFGAGAFKGSGLKAITPETFPFVTEIGYLYNSGVFEDSELETVDWPSLVYVKDGRTFQNCKSLRSVNLQNYIGNKGENGSMTFEGCTSLKDVNLPAATLCPSFSGCTSLESIMLPLAVAVGSFIFDGCTNLRTIDLPACTSIGSQCTFRNCSKLEAIILRSKTVCTLNLYSTSLTHFTYVFMGSGIAAGTGYIYVPKTLADGSDGVAAYRAATNWSHVAAQIRAIEDYPDICGG